MARAYKRGRTWTAKWELGRSPDGKRRTATQGGFKTEKEADHFAEEQEAAVRGGTYVPPSRLTVKEYLDSWLTVHASTKRPRTAAGYESIVRVHLAPRLGHLRLHDMGPLHVQEAYAGIREAGISDSTLHHIHRTLSLALQQAVDFDMLRRNPCRVVHIPTPERHDVEVLTPEQLRTLIDTAKGTILEALVPVAACTGLRRSELLGLQWGDLDGGRLAVKRTRQWLRKVELVGPCKTKRSHRTVVLQPEVAALLEAQPKRSLWLFDMTGDQLSAAWSELRERAGFPGLRLHDLRHGFASLLFNAGATVADVSKAMGHGSPDVTLHIYAHALPDGAERAADIFRKAMEGGR